MELTGQRLQKARLEIHIPPFSLTENAPSPRVKLTMWATTMPSLLSTGPLPKLVVVIGINRYRSDAYRNLSGAVADADAFESFLRTRLGVPQENIFSLRDEKASREAIVSSFRWLLNHTTYQKDEAAIIFYFAGHGAQTERPTEWGDSPIMAGKIGMLCPSDIGTVLASNDGVQAQKEHAVVQGIADRTISALLNKVADQKGTNIAVILDCCNAAGMVRSTKRDTNRSHFNPNVLPSSTTIAPTTSSEKPSKKHQSSYVVLAACGRDDFAREDPKTRRGLFTHHLLSVLEKEDIGSLTYGSLMHKLNLPIGQTPHCEGDGIHWRLFNNRVSGADKCMVLTKQDSQTGETILLAGAAQGFTVGSRFAIHASNLMETSIQSNPCLGHFVVTRTDAFNSTLASPPDESAISPPRLSYSRLDQVANTDFCVFSTDRSWLESVLPLDLQSKFGVKLVDAQEACDLEITPLNGHAYFDQYNSVVVRHLGSRMQHEVEIPGDVEIVRNLVRASAHFYRHLMRRSPRQFEGVSMELHKISEIKSSDGFDQVFIPFGKNLITEELATLLIDEKETQLGITIHNDSQRSLYPYLFYLDPMDVTIEGWYLPPIGAGTRGKQTKVDAPLPPNSSLLIGHGDEGGAPWSFSLPPNIDTDLGFFRLFLSTRPASFENILQEMTPFEPGFVRGDVKPKRQRLSSEEWSVQTFTLVQTRKL